MLNSECYQERDCAECEALDQCLRIAVGRDALEHVVEFCDEQNDESEYGSYQ